MNLFRRRFGARRETPTDDSNPPPSYEDSQDASLREVLQGARMALPLLWPSTSSSTTITSSTSYSSKTEKNTTLGADLETGKSGRNGETSSSAREDAVMEVLLNLAMAPCGDRTLLDRIRQFSDFYFTPYIASEGSSQPSHERDSTYQAGHEMGTVVPLQEHQRIALENIAVPRESAALLLCARVLERYYAGLGNIDSGVDTNITQDPPMLHPECPKGNTSDWGAGKEKGRKEIPEIRRKTKLTQIAACVVEGCICYDFDEAISTRSSETRSKDPEVFRRCGCGHPRTSHSPSGMGGISRLVRRYTNWDTSSYVALGHRSPTGEDKRRLIDIRVCSAPGTKCPCRDYDKGRRTGCCGRCGHYGDVHVPINSAREEQKPEKKRKGKRGGGSDATGADPTWKKAEWELSWILVENAYSLLNEMTQFSPYESYDGDRSVIPCIKDIS
ncbi:hypothetical protein GGR58DRAFT_503926 [Xylaria digitata]|nr:hypothetical protein GGR58DRAFT_503926 [Xylaria digitata]